MVKANIMIEEYATIQEERKVLEDKINETLLEFKNRHKLMGIIIMTNAMDKGFTRKDGYLEICTISGANTQVNFSKELAPNEYIY